MTEKIQTLLKEIELGERKHLYDVDITLEEYISKDLNGISFLEHLLKNNISINFRDEKKFGKSNEIIYLYCKYDRSLLFAEFEEEALFSEFNGKRIIDYFVRKKKLTKGMIECVKNHIEIVDIVLSTNCWQAGYINEAIMEKLMTKKLNEEYQIEKYFKDGSIKYLIEKINSPKELIELCKKYNKYDLLKYANEQVLMHKINDNYTLLEDLLLKNIIPNKLTNISTYANREFINYLRKNVSFHKFFSSAEENVLLMKFENGKTLLEELIEKGYKLELNKELNNPQTIVILYNKNRLDLATRISEQLLLTPIKDLFDDDNILGNQLLLEYMLDKGYNPLVNSYSITEKRIIKILYDRDCYKILGQKLTEEYLLIELEDGISLIDKLLEENVDINFKGYVEGDKIAKKLYENNRFDLLVNVSLNVLLKTVDNENTYLDYVLEDIKSKKLKFNLDQISFFKCSVNTIAKFYLTVAKHGMIEYLSPLTEENLLKEYDGKTLLEKLLDLDSELTLSDVMKNDVKSKMKIAIILKSRGLETKDIDVPLQQKKFTTDYLESFQNTLGVGPLLNEGEVLLKRLYELFNSDGKSEPSLVSVLINGYRHALFVNYEVNIQELRNLVEAKEKNIEKFIYNKEENGAYFRSDTGAVYCDSPVVETILHETGHALHYYLANNSVPNEYNSIIEKVKSNPAILKRIDSYANEYSKLRKKIYDIAEEKYNSFFESYFDSNRIAAVTELLKKSQIEKRDEFKLLGLSEDALDIILNNIFTIEEYIIHQKKIFISEYVDHMLRCEFGAFMAIGDILDAIYEGELHSGTLKNETGDKINRTAGHGISYYYDSNKGFTEMVANFASISKSKDSKDILNLLRSIVGDELYNMLSGFYYNNIVATKSEQLEKNKSL